MRDPPTAKRGGADRVATNLDDYDRVLDIGADQRGDSVQAEPASGTEETLERHAMDQVRSGCTEMRWIAYAFLGPSNCVDIFSAPDAETPMRVSTRSALPHESSLLIGKAAAHRLA